MNSRNPPRPPRSRRPFLLTPEDLLDEDQGPPSGGEQVDRPNPAEALLAAELISFLEDELAIDVRRLHLRVRGAVVHLQGTVDSHELRRQIEDLLKQRPQVGQVEARLSVQRSEDF